VKGIWFAWGERGGGGSFPLVHTHHPHTSMHAYIFALSSLGVFCQSLDMRRLACGVAQ
jgi:hypothetical protein